MDLLDVEENTHEMNSIRNNMIKGEKANVEVLGKISVDKAHRVLYSGIQYVYSPIPNTSYR